MHWAKTKLPTTEQKKQMDGIAKPPQWWFWDQGKHILLRMHPSCQPFNHIQWIGKAQSQLKRAICHVKMLARGMPIVLCNSHTMNLISHKPGPSDTFGLHSIVHCFTNDRTETEHFRSARFHNQLTTTEICWYYWWHFYSFLTSLTFFNL